MTAVRYPSFFNTDLPFSRGLKLKTDTFAALTQDRTMRYMGDTRIIRVIDKRICDITVYPGLIRNIPVKTAMPVKMVLREVRYRSRSQPDAVRVMELE